MELCQAGFDHLRRRSSRPSKVKVELLNGIATQRLKIYALVDVRNGKVMVLPAYH